MYYVVGLGNPGEQYRQTRHNIGFWVVDRLAGLRNIRWKSGRGEFLIGTGQRGKMSLVKPLTYMNNSGVALKQLAQNKDFDISATMIVYDDLDLPLGTIRFRPGGSPGSHRGMQSVVKQMGTQKVPRLRVGIGSDLKQGPAEDFVLAPFASEEKEIAEEVTNKAAEGVMTFIHQGIEAAMNQYNRLDLTK